MDSSLCLCVCVCIISMIMMIWEVWTSLLVCLFCLISNATCHWPWEGTPVIMMIIVVVLFLSFFRVGETKFLRFVQNVQTDRIHTLQSSVVAIGDANICLTCIPHFVCSHSLRAGPVDVTVHWIIDIHTHTQFCVYDGSHSTLVHYLFYLYLYMKREIEGERGARWYETKDDQPV